MKKIDAVLITQSIASMCQNTNYVLPDDVLKSIESVKNIETSPTREICGEILENARIAKSEKIPLCQDTGTANFFVKLGTDVKIENGDIYSAINEGVKKGYTEGYLRKSIVSDPLNRTNTADNTPANIYIELTAGNKIEIDFLPKGGGSENASAIKMLEPSAGWQGVKDFVLSHLKEKAPNACPPVIVGVGIGGDFASVGLVAKKTLLRDVGSVNENLFYAEKEKELLAVINALTIGAMGLGGKTTALAAFIGVKPCHIASLPVAVSVQCHSARKAKIIL
jgi:fumarate hydratase subunit alpha